MRNRKLCLVGAAVLAVSGTALAEGKVRQKIEEKEQAREQKKQQHEQQQACQDLQQFKSSVQRLEQAGPQTSVGEIQEYAKQARQDLKRFEKTAKKAAKPEAENVEQTAEKLRKDADNIPEGATLAQAREMIRSDVELVSMASNHLEQKLNCGLGGAGMEGQQDVNPQPIP